MLDGVGRTIVCVIVKDLYNIGLPACSIAFRKVWNPDARLCTLRVKVAGGFRRLITPLVRGDDRAPLRSQVNRLLWSRDRLLFLTEDRLLIDGGGQLLLLFGWLCRPWSKDLWLKLECVWKARKEDRRTGLTNLKDDGSRRIFLENSLHCCF
jgi:hypothetical protein